MVSLDAGTNVVGRSHNHAGFFPRYDRVTRLERAGELLRRSASSFTEPYADAAPILRNELDAGRLESSLDALHGSFCEALATLQADEGVCGHLRKRCQLDDGQVQCGLGHSVLLKGDPHPKPRGRS